MFMEIFEILWKDRDTYIEDVEILKADATQIDGIKEKIKKAEAEEKDLAEKMDSLFYENVQSVREQGESLSDYEISVREYEAKQSEIEDLKNKLNGSKTRAEAIDEFIRVLKEMDTPTQEFDMWLWGSMVENLTMETNGKVTFNIKSGMKVKVS